MALKTSYSNLARQPTTQTTDPSRALRTATSQPANQTLLGAAVQHSQNLGPTPVQQTAPISQPKRAIDTSVPAGGIPLGEPKVYDSAGSYGSGFINLSHMLGLNRGSGAKSAMDLAKKTEDAGKSAQSGLKSLEDQFAKDAAAGTVQYRSSGEQWVPSFSPEDDAMIQADKDAQAKANQGYQGPNDLTGVSGYADLAKKVSDAEQMAKNTQSGWGMAAQVNKETGLSPTQSAASAFYMGVNNPNLKRAGSAYTGLSAALAQANEKATKYAGLARQITSNAADMYGADATAKQQALDKARQDRRDSEILFMQQQDQMKADAANQTVNEQARDEHRTPETQATSDMYWAISQGMPSELAYAGIDYYQWVEEGRPTYEQWVQKHGDPRKA